MKKMITLFAILAMGTTPVIAKDKLTHTGKIDAADADMLVFDGRVGSVEITGTDDGTVSWEVTIEKGDDWGGSDVSPSEVEIKAERKDDRLRLEDIYPDGDDINLEAHWTIRMPARLALDGEMNVGEVSVRNLAGGVTFDLNVGELTIETLKGDVRAETNVGELQVVSRTRSVGTVDLETNIGDVSFDYEGGPGEKSGWLGKEVRYEGDGDDDFELETNVGEVHLTIESE